MLFRSVFFFNDTATTEIYTLSLHDALPISSKRVDFTAGTSNTVTNQFTVDGQATDTKIDLNSTVPGTQWTIDVDVSKEFVIYVDAQDSVSTNASIRSEEHTSELQSHSFISYAVFCLKKKKT